MSATDKRRTPRFKLEKDVYCYIEGVRLDVRSDDISAGGMFLRTDKDRPPLGAQIGLVFREQSDAANPTFLFGRVVREQDEPIRGVGLCWEKAVTVGPQAELVKFLTTTLGISAERVERQAAARTNARKHVFLFGADERGETTFSDPAPATPAEPEPAVLATPAPVVALGGGPAVEEGRPVGSITALIEKRALQTPTSIEASVVYRGASLTVRITRLGLVGMFVETPFIPVIRTADVSVRFVVKADGIPRVVDCTCRSTAVDARIPGMELEILEVDEGDLHGLFKTFVKQLQYQSLARS